MPITHDLASKQVLRLSGLRGYPEERAARRELGNVLVQRSHDEAHCIAVIDATIAQAIWCPTPVELNARFDGFGKSDDPYAVIQADYEEQRAKWADHDKPTDEELAELEAEMLAKLAEGRRKLAERSRQWKQERARERMEERAAALKVAAPTVVTSPSA